MTNKKLYFNRGQRELIAIGANSETIIASRRFGKSDGIIAPRLLRNVQSMPQSAGGFYAATFQQALSRTLPASIAALKRMGYHNERHFFIGRKAPKALGFKNPHIEPQSWDHVMHWYNGSIVHILSQDVKFSTNSLTLDYGISDEARSINNDKYKNEFVPAVSGMIGYYKNNPWHKGFVLVSDMPQRKSEEWLLNNKKKMDPELVAAILLVKKEISSLLQKKDSPKKRAAINKKTGELNFYRKNLHYYREFDAIENIELLGPDYIYRMKRELTPLVFLTSIMNKKITKLVGGYYANLNPNIHYYDAFDNGYLDNIRNYHGTFNFKDVKTYDYKQDADVQKNKPLIIAFDYNANINWIVTGQVYRTEMRTLKSMFVKNQNKLRELVKQWCDYYEPHPVKEVIYYYDETALQGSYASTSETFADIVMAELRKRHWHVEAAYIGKPMRHSLKHQYINDALTGVKYLFPTFNRNNNEFLLPSMETTDIKIGRNGFEKDKSGEKLPETEEDPLELRTDGTDAWDTLFVGCNFFPKTISAFRRTGNIILG